jgi:alkanesulfonate monooxygenase SsuD/methylene tetrahydromethanopterin reductase-like flavin-dependent oxidoreductase (luciferase family)
MSTVKIGYSLGSLLSIRDVLAISKLADSREVDSLWIPESWGREGFATLGAISQLTTKVRLGTAILSIFARTPATVAMAATTIDMLSNNRAVMGLGVSTEAIVENWHGIEFSKPLRRMHEYVTCLRQMITGETVNYSGSFYKINNFKLLYRPQRSEIPIFMAAINKRMVSLSTQIADGILLYLRPYGELRRTVQNIKSVRKKSSRFEIASVVICSISNDRPLLARQRAAQTLAFYVSVGKYYNKFLAANGFAQEVLEISDAYRLNGLREATKHVSERMLDALTISGNSQQCLDSFKDLRSCGLTTIILQVNPVGDPETSFREMLATFCDERSGDN